MSPKFTAALILRTDYKKNMRIKFCLIFLAAVVVSTGCKVPNQNADVKMRWSAVVCSSKAKKVTLFAGGDGANAQSFADWNADVPQKKFDLPAGVQGLSKIYLKAVAPERGQTEMCVLYDGAPKKRVEFDDEEDVHVSASDVVGANQCRCTE